LRVTATSSPQTDDCPPALARHPKKTTRVEQCHQSFVDKARDCATRTNEPSVKAVVRFLENVSIDKLAVPADFTPSDVVTFRVKGILPIDLESVRNYWARKVGGDVNETPAMAKKLMECLICGQ